MDVYEFLHGYREALKESNDYDDYGDYNRSVSRPKRSYTEFNYNDNVIGGDSDEEEFSDEEYDY